MSRLVLGTAGWGSFPYGLKNANVPLRMIRAILGVAKASDVRLLHYKPAYEAKYGVGPLVLKMAETMGFTLCDPVDTYTVDETSAAVEQHAPAISIMYNVLRPDCAQPTRDNQGRCPLDNYLGTVYARSVWHQGFLADQRMEWPHELCKDYNTHAKSTYDKLKPKIVAEAKEFGMTLAQYCLAGVLTNPYIDFVIIGVNTIAQLETALAVEKARKRIVFRPEHSLGECDETDPRRWYIRTDRHTAMERANVRPDREAARNVAPVRRGRRRRTRG